MGRPAVTRSRKGQTSARLVGPPKPIRITAPYGASTVIAFRSPRSLLAHFVHGVDQRAHVIDRRFGQDAVAEVEDMAGAAGRPVENQADAPANLGDTSEERDRIEVALHANPISNARPRLAKVDAPVEPD